MRGLYKGGQGCHTIVIHFGLILANQLGHAGPTYLRSWEQIWLVDQGRCTMTVDEVYGGISWKRYGKSMKDGVALQADMEQISRVLRNMTLSWSVSIAPS